MDISKKLYNLIEKNNVSALKILVTSVELANLTYKHESMLLHAVSLNHVEAAEVLLHKGAELEVKGLIIAVMNDNYDMVKLLLDYGMDPYQADLNGETVFDYFNYFNVDPKIQKLLKNS